MKDFLKARAYAYLHSRNLIVFLISTAIWFFGNLISVLFMDGQGVRMSSVYGVWAYMEFYLCFIPVVVTTWYGQSQVSGFTENIPFQMKDRKFYDSSIVFTFVLNLLAALLSVAGAFIVTCVPNNVITYNNDAKTMGTAVFLLVMCAFCRCSFVVFVTEWTGSRIWGSVIGMLGSCGTLSSTIMYSEAILIRALGITKSRFPISTMSNFVIFNDMMPAYADAQTDYVIKTLCGNPIDMTLKMVIYIALFMTLTYVISKRKDVM